MPLGYMTHLTSIWGLSPNDIWAVGDGSEIAHYNGSTWSRPATFSQRFVNLTGVWGTATRDVWAVGPKGLILHYY